MKKQTKAKKKSNLPKKCLACGSKKLKYVEDVNLGFDGVNDNVHDDALVCECGVSNSLNGLSYTSYYKQGTDFSEVKNPGSESTTWINSEEVGDLRQS